MRFTLFGLSTSTPGAHVVQEIIDRHIVASYDALRIYIGAELDDTKAIKPDEYDMPLRAWGIDGGSKNDHVSCVITYEYEPFKSVVHVPRNVRRAGSNLAPRRSLPHHPATRLLTPFGACARAARRRSAC